MPKLVQDKDLQQLKTQNTKLYFSYLVAYHDD